MKSDTYNNHQPSSKPLGSLGRDEMNLAEFPIALLTDRVPKAQTEAVYQDEIYDERTGRTLARKLTIKAGGYGLTTAADDEVILALIQLTRQKNDFTRRRVDFSRLELIRLLDWQSHGASYERILLSLQRWTSVYLQYENAWRDNKTKTWTSPKGFHIIDNFELADSRNSGEQFDLIQSHIIWNEVIFESFQAGYLKPLDYDLCMGLRNSTAKRLFRFLDKRFHFKPELCFELKELSHMHIGLGRNYEGPAHLKRNLLPAILELEQVGFLEPMPETERFVKEGKEWNVRLVKKDATVSTMPKTLPEIEHTPVPHLLVTELTKRGVTLKTAKKLFESHSLSVIEAQIDAFDWLLEMKDKKVSRSPAGYLVKSIEDEYAEPKGFKSKIHRAAEAKAKQEALERKKEEERQQSEREAREAAAQLARDTAVKAYLEGLSDEDRAELKCEFRAANGYGSQKVYFEDVLFNTYVAKLIGLLEVA